jgi:hypothetical protein
MGTARIYSVLRSVRKRLPEGVAAWVRRHVSPVGYDRWMAEQADPFASEPTEFHGASSPCTLGIVQEVYHCHANYVAACREMGVSYKIVDISRSDWIRRVEEADCDAYLVWPTARTQHWKEMFDDRLRVLEEDLGKVVYPPLKGMWLYENKRRIHEWLTANRIPHPRTWVFYDRDEAEQFLRGAELPLVFKTSHGSTGSGVRILRTRADAARIVRQVFTKGFVPTAHYREDRERGSVYLQEYLPNVNEWRMVRIGDSFFGYRKEKVGDFHSGSHHWSWLDPPRPLLDFLRRVTEKGGFTSMDVDTFESEDGRLLVSEMQTVFGCTTPVDQLRVNGKPGRYVYDAGGDRWIFEEGEFCRNACANCRIEYLIRAILKKA